MNCSPATRPTSLTHVLLVGKGLGLGGMEHLLLAQVRNSDPERFRYSVAFVNPEKDALLPEFEDLGVPVHRLGGDSAPWPAKLRTLLVSGGFDLVHVHSPLVASAVRVAARTVRPRTRLVYTEHNSWSAYRTPTKWANRVTYRLDDAQFAVSRAAWESVPSVLRSRLEVLDHGIDIQSVRQRREFRTAARKELGVGPHEVVVGTVANFRPEKNYEGLTRVAARVIGDDDSVRFVSIGQGPLQDEIARRHEELGLRERFLLLGGRPDATRLMAAFDIFVLASHMEGLPVAFMEARALGLPVVVTAVGGLPDHVENGVDGLLVEPASDGALVSAIEKLAASPELRSELASRSGDLAASFDVATTVRTIEARYAELMGPS